MQRFLLALLTPLLAALVGCAANNVPGTFAFGADPKDGLIVVSIADNGADRDGIRTTVYLDTNGRPVNNMLQAGFGLPLPADASAPTGTTVGGYLTVVTVPAGKHTLDGWQLRNGGGAWVQPAGRVPTLEFTIQPGEVRYLGNVAGVLQTRPGLFGVSVVEGGHIEFRDQRARDLAAFEQAYPQFKGQAVIGLLPQGRWESPAGIEISNSTTRPTPPFARR